MYVKAIEKYEPKTELERLDKNTMLACIKAFPDTVLRRENTVAHICVSAFILNEELDKVLMIHHNIYNSWGWTGGHADGNEDLLAVAFKEAEEETGVSDLTLLVPSVASLDILPVLPHVKNGAVVSSHLHLNVTYLFQANEAAPLRVKPDENSGVAWLAVDGLADADIEPFMLPIYQKLIARAKESQQKEAVKDDEA